MLTMRTARFVLAGLVFSILTGQASAAVNISDPDVLDAVLDRYVDEGYYPFIYARLEDRDGNVVYEHSVVNRELLPDAEIDGQTWIRIWSMSKIVTISTVLDLVEDGILSLEDPVTNYVPEFADMQVAVTAEGKNLSEVENEQKGSACPYELAPVDTVMTVRHLINHEAGFYYATTNFPLPGFRPERAERGRGGEYAGLHRAAGGACRWFSNPEPLTTMEPIPRCWGWWRSGQPTRVSSSWWRSA